MNVTPRGRDSPGENDRLRHALARWRAADDRLYPLAMVDADSYQHAVALVGSMLDQLRRSCNTLRDLVEVDRDPSALLAAVDPGGMDTVLANSHTLVEAACSLRSAELRVADQRRQRRARIARGHEAAADWVGLEGSRERIDSGERFTLMRLPSGQALVAFVDPFAGKAAFHLEELSLDPATGDPVGDPSTRWEGSFVDRDAWLAELARRSGQIAAALDN
jgi:hypothetical protein